jgi:MFS family permease
MSRSSRPEVGEGLPEGRTRSFWTLLVLFAGNGMQAGVYTLLVADLAQALRLSPGPLGVALSALSAGGVVGVLVFGRLADRCGRRQVLIAGCLGAGAFFIILGQVSSFSMLIVVMAAGGVMLSGFRLSPTTLGGDFERAHNTASMNPFFAVQDVGGAIGAGVAGLVLALGVSYSLVYAALGTILVFLGLTAFVLPLPPAPSPSLDLDAAPPDVDTMIEASGGSDSRLVNRGTVSALALVGLISLVDAAMEGFSSLYLRETLGTGSALAGLAIAIALLASSAGRLGGQLLLRRAGERRVIFAAACATGFAILVMVGTGLAVVAGIGLLLLRLGQGPIVPVGYSLAARSTAQRSGQATSLAWMALYAAFFAGPLLVGALAEIGGLRFALSCFILVALAIAVLAATVARPVLRSRHSN